MDQPITDYSTFPTTATINTDHPSVIPKRKPGRPSKPRPDFGFQPADRQPVPEIPPYQPQFEHHPAPAGQDLQPNHSSGPEPQGNFGGAAEPIFASLGLADEGVAIPPENAPATAKRGRGRPPKGATAKSSGGGVASSGGDAATRKRRKVGRPKLMSIMMGPVTVPLSGNVSRPRGRPRRAVSRPATSLSINGGHGESGLVSRGRGRPRKGAGGANKVRKFNGRLSKAGSGTAVLVTDPRQLVAYQELKSKYEHIQLKAKEVLNVVKPYINTDYEAFRALHELEALANA